MNGTPAPAPVAFVDAIPADAAVGTEYVVAGKLLSIVAGPQGPQTYEACNRCGGTGKTVYHWVANGVCFDCGGAVGAGTYRSIAEANKLAKARARAGAKREAAREAKLAERDAKIAEIVAADPAVGTAIAWYMASVSTDIESEMWRPSGLGRAEGFVTDLYRWNGDVPAWKVSAIVEAVERTIAAAQAEMDEVLHFAASPAPLGAGCQVTGEIVSLKWVPNHFAYNSETPKILVVTDEGWKAYATCPRKVFDLFGAGSIVGSRVSFTAELSEGSQPDPQFRIAKRPSKVAAA